MTTRLALEAIGVAGAPAPRRLTTTFRLTGGIVVDAGAVMHALPAEERAAIDTLLLTHAHLDHTLGVPFLLAETQPAIHGLQPTLDAVRQSLLDGRIWPDLNARATWRELATGDTLDLAPWSVEVGPASHTVPCVTYVFTAGDTRLAVVGDTRLDEDVVRWVADRRPTSCVVECSYEDARAEQARRFGHQTPADLRAWRAALGEACELLVFHLKPAQESRVRAECEAWGDPRTRVLQDGDVIEL